MAVGHPGKYERSTGMDTAAGQSRWPTGIRTPGIPITPVTCSLICVSHPNAPSELMTDGLAGNHPICLMVHYIRILVREKSRDPAHDMFFWLRWIKNGEYSLDQGDCFCNNV